MSEINANAYREPLPDHLREGPIILTVSWRAPKENHDKMVEHIRSNMNMQRVDPTKSFYSRTRHWYRPCDDGINEEWWFMDEYDDAEAFEAMQKRYREVFMDADNTNEHYDNWLSMLVPDSVLTQVLYSEVDGGRVEFEPYSQRKDAIEHGQEPWWQKSAEQ